MPVHVVRQCAVTIVNQPMCRLGTVYVTIFILTKVIYIFRIYHINDTKGEALYTSSIDTYRYQSISNPIHTINQSCTLLHTGTEPSVAKLGIIESKVDP